jgi:hypothetical protein
MNTSPLSSRDVSDIMSKLINDRVPVQAPLFTPSGLKTRLRSFVNSETVRTGMVAAGAALSKPVREID